MRTIVCEKGEHGRCVADRNNCSCLCHKTCKICKRKGKKSPPYIDDDLVIDRRGLVCLDCWPDYRKKQDLVGKMFLTFERQPSRTGRTEAQKKKLK